MAIGQDKTRLDFVIGKHEKALLERYCELTQRTKTDVIRELLRGLEDRLPQELPEGWVENESGIITGNWRGVTVDLMPNERGDGYAVYLNNVNIWHGLFNLSPAEAVVQAQKVIVILQGS